ncbi:MAG: hypothetical protein J5I93_03535 [Pirellulaceae bacterium]|nr:hypothetical protein [Pirellulaceae bacterium]
MATQDELNCAFGLDELELPGKPNVVDVKLRLIEDSDGDDAIEIIVVLANDTGDEDLTSEAIKQIKRTITDSLLKHGHCESRYFEFSTEQEYKEEYDRNVL